MNRDATLIQGPGLRVVRRFRQVVLILVALAVWEGVARAADGSFLVAGPGAVATYLWANAGLVGRATAVTLQSAMLGFVYGNLAAVALALVAFLVPRAERLILMLALLVFCLPLVATGPILRVLYGPGTGPQITLAALAVYFTTLLPLMVGLRAAPSSWFDLVRSYGRSALTEMIHVRAFAAIPYLIAGLQIAAPAALLGAMVGEFTGAERGLGVLTIRAMRGLDVPGTWAIAIVASGLSMLAYSGLGWMGGRLSVASPVLILSPPQEPAAMGFAAALVRQGLFVLVSAMVVLALWAGLMDGLGLNRFFAKRPVDVWQFLVTAPDAALNRAILLSALGETLRFAVPGYALGLFGGAALASGIVLFPSLGRSVLPVAIALRSVPIITTAPLIVVALGRGALGTVAIVAVMVFFPSLVACLQGLRQTPGQVLDIFESYAAGRMRRLVNAQFPAMLPSLFASARMAVPAAFLAATTAEWLATGSGIGGLMAMTASTSAYGMLWSAIAALSSLACLAYAAVGAVERQVLRRYASEQVSR